MDSWRSGISLALLHLQNLYVTDRNSRIARLTRTALFVNTKEQHDLHLLPSPEPNQLHQIYTEQNLGQTAVRINSTY